MSFFRRTIVASTTMNYRAVAYVFEKIGFYWKSVKIEQVQSNSHSISFDDEWKKFISCVATITDTPVRTDTQPWKYFEHVLDPGPGRGYTSENSFSDALFKALRLSLDDFCLPNISKTKWIAFKNSPIRLGKGISRSSLGFPEGYALSGDSTSDHVCCVMGTMPNNGRPSQKKNEDEVLWFNDLTAVVKIRLDTTSCKSFAVKKYFDLLDEPVLKRDHGPLGLALFSTLDVWHCLARRGQAVTDLSVVLLAGQAKSKPMDMDRICCFEGHLQVPECFGFRFLYSIDRIVSFDGTTGLATNEACSEELAAALRDSRDRRAIAIYIRTMRTGLEHAVAIIKNRENRNESSIVTPVSLCCQSLLREETNTKLIASPIPCEDHGKAARLRISQGELFQLVSPTKEMFLGIGYQSVQWFVDCNEQDILTSNCLIKVSCASVHSSSIEDFLCKFALYRLHAACMKNSKVKQELTKVLLGFNYSTGSNFLMTIMKDLQAGEEHFTFLNHMEIRKHGKLPQLWSAFCVLVKSLLLPMADEDVIHLDIRSDAENTYNILVGEKPSGGHNADGAIELRLIDFESAVVCHYSFGSSSRQDHAVHWDDLYYLGKARNSWSSANRYLLWQVLWIAYTWHPPSPSVSLETLRTEMNAHTFLTSWFNDKYYLDFKNWLGVETVEALKLSTMAETISKEIIEETLAALQIAFHRKPSFPEAENPGLPEQQSK